MPITAEQKQVMKESVVSLAVAAQHFVDEVGKLPSCQGRDVALEHVREALKHATCAVLAGVDLTPAP